MKILSSNKLKYLIYALINYKNVFIIVIIYALVKMLRNK